MSSAARDAQLAEPAHRDAVQLQLVDRLAGAPPAQLGRAVGRDDDQRDARLGGLRDRRVEVRARRPGGCQHHRRDTGLLRDAEREEARRSARPRGSRPGSRAPATAPARAARSATRATRTRARPRRAPAPRPAPRRGPCCGWWRPLSRDANRARSRRLASASSSISTPRPGAGREVEAPVPRRRTPARRSCRRTAARWRGRGRTRCRRSPAPRARRPRSRPARRARSRDRPGCARRSRIAARGPPTFASFTVAASHTRAAASRVLRGDDALVGRQRHVGAGAQRAPSPPASRPAAPPAPAAPISRRRSTASSTGQLPLASTRICAPRADALPGPRAPAPRRRPCRPSA